MTVLGMAFLAWLGFTVAFVLFLLRAKPSEPDFYDLTEDQTR